MLAAFPITEEVQRLRTHAPGPTYWSVNSGRWTGSPWLRVWDGQAYMWEATWPSTDMAMQVARRAVLIQ